MFRKNKKTEPPQKSREEFLAELDKRLSQIRSRVQSTTQPTSPPEIDFEAEKKKLIEAFFKVEPRYDIRKADSNVLSSIFAWVWRKDEFNVLDLDFDKGLFLYGPLGLGKSLTMLALRHYMNWVKSHYEQKRDDYRLQAWMKSASELANIYAVDGQPRLIQYADPEINLVIDEFGREPCPAKYYGTEMNVLQFLLQLRYDHRRVSVTHVTTNMQLDDVAPKYGAYVADRCLEMFNFIEFKGESFRSKL